MAACSTTRWCLLLLAAACCLRPGQAAIAFPPQTKTVNLLSDDQFVCDGTLRYIALPQAPYPSNDKKDSPYNLPDGITCSRPQGGNPSDLQGDKCGGLASIDCLPFTGIGPINSAPVGTPDNLALPPNNGLQFTLSPASSVSFTFLNWTVWDVGSGGARFVALYKGGGQESFDHKWTTNGQQADGSCGICTNCQVGYGIKSFPVTARGNQGFSGFILSQLFKDARCGQSCFDLDASYWTGMSYICSGPTCGDTNPNDNQQKPFDCGPTAELNPAKLDSTDVSASNCCLPRKCANPNPGTKPGVPVNCASFSSPLQTCTEKPAFNILPLPANPIECCECITTPASLPDLTIRMSVTPSSTTVGKTFTYTVTVNLEGLPPATADNVRVVQQLPPSFRIQSVDDLSNDGRVTTSTGQVTVTYPKMTLPSSPERVFRVTVVADQPGTRFVSTATVSTTTEESDYSNNDDSITVSVKETIPDLSISITGPVAPGEVGSRFPFTIVVRMTSPTSPATAQDVKVIAPFPEGLKIISAIESPNTGGVIIPGPSVLQASWRSMSVPSDSTKTIVVIAEAKKTGTFPVPASVSTSTQESNYNNNRATAVAIVNGQDSGDIDLSITMSSSTSTVQVNQVFQYTINVKMTASSFNAIAQFVQVISNMPSGIVIESVQESPNRGGMIKLNPSRTQMTVTWTSMTYPYDDSRTLIVNARATKQGTFDTSARASSTTPETTLINNDANVVVTAQGSQPGNGACCNRQTGMCQDNVPESQCSGIWSASGTCQAGGFCSGACCRSDSTCAQTLKKDCYDGSWSLYGSCTKCNGGSCTPEWQRCNPNSNDCCSGLTCEYTWAGCKVGAYVCKRKPNSQCVGEGTPCGGGTGNICCKGLNCQWDFYNQQGSCKSSSGCIAPGGSCSSDYSCCRGCLCMNGKSRYVTYSMCNKGCSSYNCYHQRQANCQAFYASAASL